MCRCEKIARLRRRAVLVVVALALAALGACSTPLPDPQSAGAQIYQVRCSGCHALYAPASPISSLAAMACSCKIGRAVATLCATARGAPRWSRIWRVYGKWPSRCLAGHWIPWNHGFSTSFGNA